MRKLQYKGKLELDNLESLFLKENDKLSYEVFLNYEFMHSLIQCLPTKEEVSNLLNL